MAVSESLTKQLNAALSIFSDNVNEEFDQALEMCADHAANMLKSSSPQLTGDYKKGWTYKKQNGVFVVHNKTNYQLTHLLENGHDIIRDGKKVGHSDAIPHIADAEAWVIENAESIVEDALR